MLNFYNYYDKIHPELMKKLKDLEEKSSGNTGNNDTLIIRVHLNDFEGDENMFAKGEVIFTHSFGTNETIELSNDEALHILRDVKVIMVYRDYSCDLLYKNYSDASNGVAYFGTANNGIILSNNTLTRKLPS